MPPPKLKAESMAVETKAQAGPSWDLMWKILTGLLIAAIAIGSFKGTTSTSVDGLSSKVEELKSQITNLQTTNAAQVAQVQASNATQYQSLVGKVDSLSNQVNNASQINGERIKGVEDSVTDIKSQIADIKAQLRSK